MKSLTAILVLLTFAFGPPALAQSKKSIRTTTLAPAAKDTNTAAVNPPVTFVELGSVNCIPCKAMQPVMRAIEAKYGGQIKVVFYDVWKKEQAHYAQQYNIRLIPTQVILDANGKELIRHEGFFPEKQIDTFLESKGLKPRSGKKE
jgi:thioredoxin 1